MNTTRSRLRILAQMAWWLFVCQASPAAIIIVDTFDEGGFTISSPGNSNPSDETVNLPLAQHRSAALSSNGTNGTVMSGALNSSTGKLNFLTSGTSISSIFPLSLQLVYAATLSTQSIAGCTDFILGFSELSGVGTLYVEMGSSNGPSGTYRMDLTGPGNVFFPVSGVRLNPGHTLDAFTVLRFVFEARSPQFSFTLDEIRLVPEPSASVLALAAAAAGLLGRRRAGII